MTIAQSQRLSAAVLEAGTPFHFSSGLLKVRAIADEVVRDACEERLGRLEVENAEQRERIVELIKEGLAAENAFQILEAA